MRVDAEQRGDGERLVGSSACGTPVQRRGDLTDVRSPCCCFWASGRAQAAQVLLERCVQDSKCGDIARSVKVSIPSYNLLAGNAELYFGGEITFLVGLESLSPCRGCDGPKKVFDWRIIG